MQTKQREKDNKQSKSEKNGNVFETENQTQSINQTNAPHTTTKWTNAKKTETFFFTNITNSTNNDT